MSATYFKDILIYWAIPPGVTRLIRRSIQRSRKDEIRCSRLCAPNIQLKNIHQGQRCFIVCSGPSLREQNLLPLEHEITCFVSGGFLHPDYSAIQPNYHCFPGIMLTPKLSREEYVQWFKLMDSRIGNTQLFLSANDEDFIKQNNLFGTRRLNYLHMGLNWNYDRKEIFDITQKIPPVQSVAIMAMMIAMYMGCKEIYLLGVQLDELWSGEYKHFYHDDPVTNDLAVNAEGKSITPLIEMFKAYYSLWQQFDILRRIAEANNIEILNATRGGALDVYKRVKLEALF